MYYLIKTISQKIDISVLQKIRKKSFFWPSN